MFKRKEISKEKPFVWMRLTLNIEGIKEWNEDKKPIPVLWESKYNSSIEKYDFQILPTNPIVVFHKKLNEFYHGIAGNKTITIKDNHFLELDWGHTSGMGEFYVMADRTPIFHIPFDKVIELLANHKIDTDNRRADMKGRLVKRDLDDVDMEWLEYCLLTSWQLVFGDNHISYENALVRFEAAAISTSDTAVY